LGWMSGRCSSGIRNRSTTAQRGMAWPREGGIARVAGSVSSRGLGCTTRSGGWRSWGRRFDDSSVTVAGGDGKGSWGSNQHAEPEVIPSRAGAQEPWAIAIAVAIGPPGTSSTRGRGESGWRKLSLSWLPASATEEGDGEVQLAAHRPECSQDSRAGTCRCGPSGRDVAGCQPRSGGGRPGTHRTRQSQTEDRLLLDRAAVSYLRLRLRMRPSDSCRNGDAASRAFRFQKADITCLAMALAACSEGSAR